MNSTNTSRYHKEQTISAGTRSTPVLALMNRQINNSHPQLRAAIRKTNKYKVLTK